MHFAFLPIICILNKKPIMYKRTKIIKEIISNLAFLSKSTSLENVIGWFDSNRDSQTFFKGLFNRIFGFDLKELDIEYNVINYPAIDLGDTNKKIAIQITTDSSSTKIKATINMFQTNEKCANFERLVIFIIGDKENYTTTFDTNGRFKFLPKNDIWDDKYLVREINKIQNLGQLEDILEFLKKELLEVKFPEILIQEDIKDCINILERDFGSTKSIRTSIEPRNGDDFIIRKNSINSVSWDFFKNRIRGHIKYNKEINDFLSDPINKDSQYRYFGVTQAIQSYYQEQKQPYSFENIFREVFSKISSYDDDVPGLTIKLKIILHNMYFNCDIGNNPNENA